MNNDNEQRSNEQQRTATTCERTTPNANERTTISATNEQSTNVERSTNSNQRTRERAWSRRAGSGNPLGTKERRRNEGRTNPNGGTNLGIWERIRTAERRRNEQRTINNQSINWGWVTGKVINWVERNLGTVIARALGACWAARGR